MVQKHCVQLDGDRVIAVLVCQDGGEHPDGTVGTCSPATCPFGCATQVEGVGIGAMRQKDGSFVNPDMSAPEVTDISKLQFMLQAKADNLWAMVKATLAANPDAQDEFDMTSVITKDNPLLLAMAAQVGMTKTQVDAFFEAAALL